MTHPQKGKGGKRPRAWHRGRAAGRKWRTVRLPTVIGGVPLGAPVPNRRGPGGKVRTPESL